jgi:hypothetical protein
VWIRIFNEDRNLVGDSAIFALRGSGSDGGVGVGRFQNWKFRDSYHLDALRGAGIEGGGGK